MAISNPTYYTLEGLQTLQAAIQSGTRSVYYGDKRVDYRSFDEMIRTQNLILAALGLTAPNVNRTYGQFNEGFSRCAGGFEGGHESGYVDEDGFINP